MDKSIEAKNIAIGIIRITIEPIINGLISSRIVSCIWTGILSIKNNEEEINLWTKLLVDEAEKITKNREEIFNKVTAKVPEFFNKLPLDERWKKIASQLSFKFFKGYRNFCW